MSTREKYLLGALLFCLVVIILLIALPRGGERPGSTVESSKISSSSAKSSGEKQPKASKVEFSELRTEVKALTKNIEDLETEIVALKKEPTSEKTLMKNMAEVGRSSRDWDKLADELKKLDPDKSFELFTKVWPTLTSDRQRWSLLGAFSRSRHPRIMDILNYGINDPSPGVQKLALDRLKGHTLKDFSNDLAGYEEWREGTKDMTLEEVVTKAFDERSKEAYEDDGALQKLMKDAKRLFDKKLIPQDKMLKFCEHTINERSPNAVVAVLEYLGSYQFTVELNEEYLRRVVVPILTNPDEVLDNVEVQTAAIRALVGKNNIWSIEVILPILDKEFKSDNARQSYYTEVANTVETTKYYEAIPKLIEIIKRDPKHATYYIGYFGLSRLTGVSYHESHDGEWWENWWEKNKSRFINDEGN